MVDSKKVTGENLSTCTTAWHLRMRSLINIPPVFPLSQARSKAAISTN
jgi:hypothetical protein